MVLDRADHSDFQESNLVSHTVVRGGSFDRQWYEMPEVGGLEMRELFSWNSDASQSESASEDGEDSLDAW
eukprot:CAMPEP_0184315824 /NCGR_PEP_ID=MMETSP1049-20130417/85920_1 /TAXON_ID=77928 /ORGANISM="Proteomonas sulcata, Strain CCMP704" /LENGTH=69 /DNA_ID=CAMNT_0026634529 /DNA_START=395 /DNA_END=601 /DNA_ORIENTATION=-